MSHAYAKLLLPAILGLLVASCSSGNDADSDARQLYDSITASIDAQQYTQALEMMARLDSVYPKAFEQRRQAMALRPRVMEGFTLQQIQRSDSLMTQLLAQTNTLGALFDKVADRRQVAPYQVIKTIRGGDIASRTAIEPRIDEDSQFYIVASHQGRNIGLQSLTLNAADGSSATSGVIPSGDERVVRTPTGEMAIFGGLDADTLGALASQHPGTAMTLSFNGSRGNQTLRLSPAMVTAIGQTWQYARAMQLIKEGNVERERLERQLRIARNQMANAQ